MAKTIRDYAKEVLPHVIELRRDIHAHPEEGMTTVRTASKVCEELDRLGITYRKVEDNGVIAEIKGEKGNSQNIVMLRADMDALCTFEKTDLEFKSQVEGKMHACGHDLHTSMLLGTASILNQMKDQFDGTIRLLFQPGEEIAIGAKYLIEHGAMEGVGMGFGFHVDPLSPSHTVLAKPGSDWAAVDHFYITVHGTGAHGATPQDGYDATVAASAIVMNLQTMVSRECNPMKPLVVTVGSFHSGNAFNIVSDTATLEGTCRSFDLDIYDMIPTSMERIAKQTAEAFHCTADVRVDRLGGPLINDEHAYEVLKNACKKVLRNEEDFKLAVPAMIGEDFAEYGKYCPIVFAHLGCDGGYPLHSSYVNFKEEAMETGMCVEVQFALDALEDLSTK
ncbi:MAG: amidohydrolase [Solobacterium sp.]|nr:amidohydrolase [Solobacterium sp.]